MSTVIQRSTHPALEALDASADGLPREVFEPAVMWLAVNDGLSTEIAISPSNGRFACSDDVIADLFRGLADGFVRLDGDRFVLTGSGVDRLEHLDCRATQAARRILAGAPNDVTELLADVERKLSP
jgi:hypothetical protein